MSDSRLLWTPPSAVESNLSRYTAWLQSQFNLRFSDYYQLWKWSVDSPAEFWKSIWLYFDIAADGTYHDVVSGTMPRCRWFEGTQLNYAEHIFRQYCDDRPAILYQTEGNVLQEISWKQLRDEVAALRTYLANAGVKPGDCVAGYLPNVPEATVAFLAANSLGAVWSSCSPDFGVQSVIDRFAQVKPRVLVAATSYTYGGKSFDKTQSVAEIAKSLPELSNLIAVGDGLPAQISGLVIHTWAQSITDHGVALSFQRVPFSHPIWVLYSSGTTGLPKAITHSHGGILLEHLKYLTFHNDVRPGERFFWYTTTGWMMWNYLQSSLLCGGVMVLFDGSPGHPDRSILWKLTQDASLNHFGTSASFILSNLKAGLTPNREFNLASLRSIGSTGSTLPPEGFDWVYNHVKQSVWLASMSGGTDVCSAFVGGNPQRPVYSGEIQCRALGCSLYAWDENGHPQTNEVGEMVITQPMPSMPIYFWNDPEFVRYRESYFEMFPGVWRHGDWIQITSNDGVIIYGRSDATLNRGGVRIGTSEIYRALNSIPEIKDGLIVCIEREQGEFFMPLFVQMQEGHSLDDSLRKRINNTIRQDYSPRHIPDQIIAVPDIPYTISGKKTETPVKKILMGKALEASASTGSLRNPASLEFFVSYYKKNHPTK